MKLAASVSLMFRELPLLDRFDAARRAGFHGVEIQRLHEGDPAEMARAAQDAGVQVVLVNCGLADYLQGGPGLSGVPGRELEFRETFAETLEAAHLLSAQHIHLGPSRVPSGASRAHCHATYRDNIRLALAASAKTGASLLIEAMNPVDAPDALITDPFLAATLIRQFRQTRLGLQFDVYHVAMSGSDPVISFEAVQPIVRHVQFADAPGRHEPGTGQLDVPRILAALADLGYAGWFGAEYYPAGATPDGLGWLASLVGSEAAG